VDRSRWCRDPPAQSAPRGRELTVARSILRTLRLGRVRPATLILAVGAMVAVTSCAAASHPVNMWPRPADPPGAEVMRALPPEQRDYADDLASLSAPGTAAAYGFDPRLLGLTARQANELAALQQAVALLRSALRSRARGA